MPAQFILSVDATVNPASLQVSEVDGRSVRVVESVEADLRGMFDVRDLDNLPSSENDLSKAGTSETLRAAHGSQDHGSQEPGSSDQPSAPSSNPLGTLVSCTSSLREALSQLQTPYTSSILIIPTDEYLSLNLDLPFSDNRQIQKILELEVQDRVPFDTSEFLLEHRSLNGLSGNPRAHGHDVHVSIVPRKLLSRVTRICKGASFEPLIITTASSILEGLFILAPDYFKDNSAVILVRPPFVYVALQVDGRVRVDRVINAEQLTGDESERIRSLSTELRLTLVSVETRYGVKIDSVYALGDGINLRELQQHLGRNVESVDISELVNLPPETRGISALGVPFAYDDTPHQILTNFRTREFSYSLQLSELVHGLRKLAPLFAITFFCSLLLVVGSYFFRETKIDLMEANIHEAISASFPGTSIGIGEEVSVIQAENSKLDKALESLGSGSLDQYTALDVLREISVVMPTNPAITIRNIAIRGNRVKISGSAPEYKDVEAIERALQRNRSMKFRAKPPEITAGMGSIPGGARSSQNFTFDIRVED